MKLDFLVHLLPFKTICTSRGTACASNLTVDTSDCLVPCEGIFADVTKHQAPKISGEYYEKLVRSYDRYKRFFDISDSKDTKQIDFFLFPILGFQIPSTLRYVNIFFDTPTFDKITKDRSAKVSKYTNIMI